MAATDQRQASESALVGHPTLRRIRQPEVLVVFSRLVRGVFEAEFTATSDAVETLVVALARLIKSRDPNTQAHCVRLADYAVATGISIGLRTEDLTTLRHGSYLHDFGKIAIPDSILWKPRALTRDEFARMQQHSRIGDHLCEALPLLHHVRPIILSHHERLDGSGYPDGLRGDRIPLLAQVIGIADVYDALVTERPYKPALSADVAREELMGEAKRGWRRKDLVEAFIASTFERSRRPSAYVH
jgi:putative two-component system response regulator